MDDLPHAGQSGEGQKRGVRRPIAAVCGLVIAGVVVLGIMRMRAPEATPPAEALRVALSQLPHTALIYIAQDKGYFTEEGLAVTLIPVPHGKAAIELLAQDQADLAAASEVPFVIAVMNGANYAIAATVANLSNGTALVARRDSGIVQPDDLAGKNVGVTFGTSAEYFLWAFLIRHKIAPERLTLVDVQPDQMVPKLALGAIDAASTWQPYQDRALTALGVNAVSFNGDSAYAETHIVVGRSEYLAGHPTLVVKLVRGLLKAERFVRAEPQQAAALDAELLKTDPAKLPPGWSDMSFRVDLRQAELITLEEVARWAMARGYAPRQELPNFVLNLYVDALATVLPERVTVVR